MTQPDDQQPKPVSTSDLWAAADKITRTSRTRLQRDDGRTTYSEHVTLPSLWDQLVEAIDSGAGKHTRGTQRSKAPCDDSALALTIAIATGVRDGCLDAGIKRTRDVPKDLRAIVSHVIRSGDEQAWRTTLATLRSWVGRIKATISNDPDRTWRLHGAACRVCSSTTVPVFDDDGTETRAPALIVHSDGGVIDKITCDFCGSTLSGPDLTSIVLDTLKAVAARWEDERMSDMIEWARGEGRYHVRDFPGHKVVEQRAAGGSRIRVVCRSCNWSVAAGQPPIVQLDGVMRISE